MTQNGLPVQQIVHSAETTKWLHCSPEPLFSWNVSFCGFIYWFVFSFLLSRKSGTAKYIKQTSRKEKPCSFLLPWCLLLTGHPLPGWGHQGWHHLLLSCGWCGSGRSSFWSSHPAGETQSCGRFSLMRKSENRHYSCLQTSVLLINYCQRVSLRSTKQIQLINHNY